MRITPLDVRKQEFRRAMRGYDADEVRAFLVTLADEYEAVLVDNKQLRERVLEQDEKLAEYRNLERTLRDTLMTAERVAQEARDTARHQGELLVEEARQRVARVLAEGRAHLDELRREALAVYREKETFLGRFRSLAEAQIRFVETHRSDFKALDGRLLDQTQAPAPTSGQSPGLGGQGNEPPAPAAPVHRAEQRDQWRDYAIKENETPPTSAEQDRAIEAVLDTLTPSANQPPAAPASPPPAAAAAVQPAGDQPAPAARPTNVLPAASPPDPWQPPRDEIKDVIHP